MMIVDDEKTFDKQAIADSFCKFFTTIGNKLQDQVISLQNRVWKSYDHKNMRSFMKVNSTFNFQPTNQPSIEKLLKSVKTSKVAGQDNISRTYDKRCL